MNPSERENLRVVLNSSALRGFRRVIEPDHPLVFRGPDALLSAPENICVVFVPTPEERKNPARLASRLIATRLAYPAETRCLLIRSEDALDDEVERDFDASVGLQQRQLIELLVSPGDRPHKLRDTAAQEKTIERFDSALRASLLSYKWQRRFALADRTGRAWSSWKGFLTDSPSVGGADFRNRRLEQRNRYLFRGVPVVFATGRSRAGLQRRTRSAAEVQFLADFDLVDGNPLLRSSGTVAVLVATDWIGQLSEASKTVVAAAFAGLAIAPTSDPEVVENFIERIPGLRRSERETSWDFSDE